MTILLHPFFPRALEGVSHGIVLGRPEEVNAFIQKICQFWTKLLTIVLVSCGALWNPVENTLDHNLPPDDEPCKRGSEICPPYLSNSCSQSQVFPITSILQYITAGRLNMCG
jgi:hypothetical protein